MKKTIIAGALLLAGLAAHADTYEHTLRVNLNNGSQIDFLFSSTPVATFEGPEMTITTDHGQETISWAMADVRNMEILGKSDAVESLKAGSAASFTLTSGTLTGAGFEAGARVELFSLAGARVASAAADAQGRVEIALGELPAGVYVVTAPGAKFKFIK